MRNKFLIFILFIFSSCITTPRYQPVTNSFGTSDLAKYKTFTVANTSTPNTPEFLRDNPIVQNVAIRFQQEGFQYVNNIDEADMLLAVSFLDQVGQDYIPPVTYTSVNYNPGVTTTNTTGNVMGFGNFATLQASSTSTSTGSMSASSTTRGGYFVPNYGIAIAINIFDPKTKQLIWSGTGANRANIQNLYAAVDPIILTIIDQHLITPAYLGGDRKQIRQGTKIQREDEYLKPVAPTEKIGYYGIDFKDEVNNVGILCRVGTQGQMLVLTLSIKNNTDENIEVDLSKIELTLQGEKLLKFSKSDVAESFFKGKIQQQQPITFQQGGVIGMLLGSMRDSIINSQNQRADEAVRFVYERYLESRVIKPGEHSIGYLYIAGPMIFSENENLKVLIPIGKQEIPIEFAYQKNWMTVKEFKKKFK